MSFLKHMQRIFHIASSGFAFSISQAEIHVQYKDLTKGDIVVSKIWHGYGHARRTISYGLLYFPTKIQFSLQVQYLCSNSFNKHTIITLITQFTSKKPVALI